MKTSWVCDCTHINPCDELDLRPGSVVQCANCQRMWVQARLRRGEQVWFQVCETDVKLHNPTGPKPPRPTADDDAMAETFAPSGQGEP
jgi:hypothetical protein